MRSTLKCSAAVTPVTLPPVDQKAIESSFENVMKVIEKANIDINTQDFNDEYNIANFNIDKLSHDEVRKLHHDIIQKYKVRKLKRNWCENELKLFVWVLFNYEAALGIKLHNFVKNNLTQGINQWTTVSELFVNKKVEDCKFQWLSLLKVIPPNEEWTAKEDELLLKIISGQESDNRWNDVAKELYRLSDQSFFRRPKQCRERWRNYLDPHIEKGQWSQEEDSTLLEYVLEIGKKWSAIAKCMKNRTEHAVKNRFKSLVKRYKKDNPKSIRKGRGGDSEAQIIKNILKQLDREEVESFASHSEPQEIKKKTEQKTKKKKSKQTMKKQKQIKEEVNEESKRVFYQLPLELIKEDPMINDRNAVWTPTPVTPFAYMEKNNKQYSNLIVVTSPRLLSPRLLSPAFRNISWNHELNDSFMP